MTAETVAAFAGAAAAFVAAVQLAMNRDEANKRAVLTHVREIESRMDPLFHLNAREWQAIQGEVLNCYQNGGNLGDEARKYLSLLNAMDFAALAVRMDVVHGPMLREYLQTQIDKELVTAVLLKDIQHCYHKATYKDLLDFIETRHYQ